MRSLLDGVSYSSDGFKRLWRRVVRVRPRGRVINDPQLPYACNLWEKQRARCVGRGRVLQISTWASSPPRELLKARERRSSPYPALFMPMTRRAGRGGDRRHSP